MKVETTNDTWEDSQKFEHVGVGHQPSVHAGICNSHVCHYVFRFICSWLNQHLRWTPPQKWIQTLTSCWQKVALSTCVDENTCLDLDFPRCYMCENLNLIFKKIMFPLIFTVQLWLPVGFSSRTCLWHHFVFLTLNNGIKRQIQYGTEPQLGLMLEPARNPEPLYELFCSSLG